MISSAGISIFSQVLKNCQGYIGGQIFLEIINSIHTILVTIWTMLKKYICASWKNIKIVKSLNLELWDLMRKIRIACKYIFSSQITIILVSVWTMLKKYICAPLKNVVYYNSQHRWMAKHCSFKTQPNNWTPCISFSVSKKKWKNPKFYLIYSIVA